MPTVLRIGGYRFFFWSLDREEPPHVHVESAERRAKFWLDRVALASNHGFRSAELGELHQIILGHRAELLRAWYEYFED